MLKFLNSFPKSLKAYDSIVFIGKEAAYKRNSHKQLIPEDLLTLLAQPLKEVSAGPKGKAITTYTGKANPEKLTVVIMPDQISRYNSPTCREFIYQNTAELTKAKNPLVICALEDEEHYLGTVCAIGRHLHPYTRKSNASNDKKAIHAVVVDKAHKILKPDEAILATLEGLNLSCSIIDTPPEEMNPDSLSKLLKKRFSSNPKVKIKEIVGERLLSNKMGGIHAVGRAATQEPRMVILDYTPTPKPAKTVAMIGKGVTYDSGGLSLKISGSMVGMKMDLSGAAAVIGAFESLINSKHKNRIVACVGLVENAIGPNSYKNDDILLMHSGKTVEINNTDAEGRLVLADCISYTCRQYKPDLVVDIATLTGAQLIATGKLHAALVANDEKLEKNLIEIGTRTGDLLVPLAFVPEVFQDMFSSELADMKNSVNDRMNAQTSCAAQFIYSHIDDLNIPWAHVDMAGPATDAKGLGVGYGVSLLSELGRS